MKISFFWSRIPHYAQACLRELMNQSDHSINIYSLDHPPDFFKEKLIDFVVLDPQDPDFYQQCQEALNASDLIVASGWMYKNFCRALSEVKKTKKEKLVWWVKSNCIIIKKHTERERLHN